ncbi:MAG TPA: S-layer protein [Methanoregula sp.]|nr:S-layer protein [Methanoregula sp.]
MTIDTGARCTGNSGIYLLGPAGRLVVIIAVLAACLATPVMAGTKYLGGSPELAAYINGTNEFLPGSEVQIPVVIENDGLNTGRQVAPDIVTPDTFPATAKFVTVGMSAGDAPLVIKSDPRMIGDLDSQTRTIAVFDAKIDADAPGGTYQVPLTIQYSRLDSLTQYSVDQAHYYYVEENATLTIPLVVKPEVIPVVVSATSDDLVAGGSGYLDLTVRNIGSLDGSNTTIKIVQAPASPVSPLDTSVFIGPFPAGSTVSCRYKVAAEKTALNKTYPVAVVVVYQNAEGDFLTSPPETAGARVGNKADFEVLSPPAEISPGSRETIHVEYRNTGDSPIRSATAHISIVNPFTSASDVAYLGDLAPGQSAVAAFELSVTNDATVKRYGLTSEIRYLDALDNTYVSDPITVPVDVKNLTGLTAILSNTVYLSVIALGVFGMLFMAWRRRRKKRI